MPLTSDSEVLVEVHFIGHTPCMADENLARVVRWKSQVDFPRDILYGNLSLWGMTSFLVGLVKICLISPFGCFLKGLCIKDGNNSVWYVEDDIVVRVRGLYGYASQPLGQKRGVYTRGGFYLQCCFERLRGFFVDHLPLLALLQLFEMIGPMGSWCHRDLPLWICLWDV